MKLKPNDCLRILRKFELATEDDLPRDISRLDASNPQPTNTLVAFRLRDENFAILIDDEAQDDEAYVLKQAARELPGRHLSLVDNPLSKTKTFAMPYEGKSIYLLKVDANRQRLDSYLAASRPELSRSSWQKHIKSGHVMVNQQVQAKVNYLVNPDDDVSADLPVASVHDGCRLPIVYIDDDVIVVDKPTGILTHGKNQLDDEFTVADFFQRYMTQPQGGDRPGVVHRLDRDTSGLLIGARHPVAHAHLKSQFANRCVDKTYYAVVEGEIDQPSLHIDLPIARNPSKPGTFVVRRNGKAAKTDVNTIKKTTYRSLLELKPITGRTHQLRVHMSSVGLPIVGDRLYGQPDHRLYLHAAKLELELPSGKVAKFESEIPKEFNDAIGSRRD